MSTYDMVRLIDFLQYCFVRLIIVLSRSESLSSLLHDIDAPICSIEARLFIEIRFRGVYAFLSHCFKSSLALRSDERVKVLPSPAFWWFELIASWPHLIINQFFE